MFEIHPVKKVSVVIPVYNEQESLPELIRRTTTACESLGKEYEILLIDDGSSDNSAHMLVEASQAENSHIVSILLNRNYGQHSAIMAGFSHVTGDLIITLDADLQNPREEIPRLEAKGDEATFWKLLDERLVLARKALMTRIARLEGVKARVVSMPSTDAFDKQDAAYRESVLPKAVTARVAVEAGIADYWYKYVGLNGAIVGMTTFGESAPAELLFEEFGFTVDNVVAKAKELL